ncbi:FtsX-like permease family protein [Actinomadura madurae]|uniref:FtsX-like permease family protein n=1 Tax=Actinomadura madurae TaxID=1993 RepID=UPI0020D221EE|nr:FtsX-like permease family protein [Actinomadura madurae]MCP9954234.1 FtsX-like permease family protein [Actinomadura madurae]
MRDGVASALGGGHQAFTGAALASERTRPDDLIRQILLVASAVALFTGAFLIRNTFSITLAARTRELALLRCVGAGRGQLRRSILLEAAIVGAVAAALGLVAGVGVAWVLGGLLHAGGAIVTDVSGAAPRILPRTVATAMAVGVIAAAASAWGRRDARRGCRPWPPCARTCSPSIVVRAGSGPRWGRWRPPAGSRPCSRECRATRRDRPFCRPAPSRPG